MTAFRLLLILSLGYLPALWANATIYPVPAEVQSDRFLVTIDGQRAPVTHAATTYHFINFDIEGEVQIAITAPADDYWAKGIEVQPWRLNIRPVINGRTATFRLRGPAKISVTRPGDHLAGAEMLFLFANTPEPAPSMNQPGIRYFGPGIHRENVDARDGQTIYLAAGAVVFGSLNLWGVHNVKVSGRGTIIYDGPQNPATDEGWMHRRNWHVIVTDHASDIRISGITCVVRSRTWMIQMLESRRITFDNVKVIGGCPGNANQDGMDWLGGGDTLVRDCFFRASDDIFALYGNWLGYTPEALKTPGADVTNIKIERCVLSTSISNVVRVSWPKKIFNSRNFMMSDTDVIHMGIGGCGIPFALVEIWNDAEGSGHHLGYRFERIWLEDWYSLTQLQQERPAIRGFTFKNIWALEQPSKVPSNLHGDVADIRLDNAELAGFEKRANSVAFDVTAPTLQAQFGMDTAVSAPGQVVTFDAASTRSQAPIASYEWLFGDGTRESGVRVRHAFPDTDGTLHDGSRRFRVLLKVTDAQGNVDWVYQPAIVATSLRPPVDVEDAKPGLGYSYYEGNFASLSDVDTSKPIKTGTIDGIKPPPGARGDHIGVVYDGFLDVPSDGGYSFLLTARDYSEVQIDGKTLIMSPPPVRQVCGSVGNAAQSRTGIVALKQGHHQLRILMTQGEGDGGASLRWRRAGTGWVEIPADVLSHRSTP